ncbi:MAG: hypothetical protein A3D48_04160 [Candidatus Yanofskybacteria bacterium RIFCSPHIGHO2_02_FULL_43_17]|uniref:Uncharacterized protein n=1 Tax=Candidatus Staskawiczbacteria bacterium RIFCSPHIGHO2_12_FULL_38_11 TaxID=1802209 RepID=A0A1G2I7B0_9BACT|nr:MAG: hypothetical protein A3D48_04160 [Candidatus Yanofskybacteria bacterium RIFCSPHIGHO2_02_FULL_43_17]OGZ70704.1 MAG: hypothetical protein A3F47_01855 [Candidatus Staskawiczbacteria bacterium RIFCSPHIGHO2_12_FULL_38_11]
MKIELNLVVATGCNGELATVEPIKASTPQEAHKEYGFSEEEKVVRVCHLVLEDEGSSGYMSQVASAYQAGSAIDAMGDGDPHMRDTFMFFFLKGFQEGMKHQAEQEAKPVIVQ